MAPLALPQNSTIARDRADADGFASQAWLSQPERPLQLATGGPLAGRRLNRQRSPILCSTCSNVFGENTIFSVVARAPASWFRVIAMGVLAIIGWQGVQSNSAKA